MMTPDYLLEAMSIARGESSLLPTRQHVKAVIAYASRLEQQIEQPAPAGSGQFAACGLCGTRTSKDNRCIECDTVVCYKCKLTDTCHGMPAQYAI